MNLPNLESEIERDCERITVSAPRRTGTLTRIVGLMLEAQIGRAHV